MSTTKLSVNCVPTYFPHLRHSVTLWWSYSNINWCLPSARILNIWCSCSHSGDLGLMHEEWLRHLQSRSGIVEQFTTKMVIRTVNSDYIASFVTNKQYQSGMVMVMIVDWFYVGSKKQKTGMAGIHNAKCEYHVWTIKVCCCWRCCNVKTLRWARTLNYNYVAV